MDDDDHPPLSSDPMLDAAHEPEPHRVGGSVALRSLRCFPDRGVTVSFAVAGTVLQDDQDFFVVMTRPGSGRAARAGARTGPRGRNVATHGWDGSYEVAVWEGQTVVRVHPRGRSWSVWRWHDGRDWTRHWYGNLESPWRRTAIGYDTQDWALDVVADGTPGTPDWEVGLKDEDELEWYTDQGVFSPEHAARTRRAGEELVGALRDGSGLTDQDWSVWVPPSDIGPVPLPPDWSVRRPDRARRPGA